MMRLQVTRLAVITTLVLLVSACGLSLKEKAVRQVQAIDTVLSSVQDTEISLYASGAIPQLTEAKHRAFHGELSKAFDAEERVAIALKAWKADDPAPQDVGSILTTAQQALAVLEGVVPEQHRIWQQVTTWVSLALELQRLMGGV